MKLFNFDRVLCLSPHPDDVEYSMSGMVDVNRDTQFDTICMSFGGEDDPTAHPDRFEEVREFWSVMGCDNINLNFEYGFVGRYKESKWIDLIENRYLGDAQCIVLCSSNDAHFEHRIVNSIANPLTRKNKISIIEYRSPSTISGWVPNFFVELSDELLDRKIKSLQQFETQTDAPYFWEDTIPSFHTEFSATKRGVKYVEPFKIIQLFS